MNKTNLTQYCGHYFSEESLLARQIILVDYILFYQRNAESKTELIASGENRFQLKETELFLQFDLSGQTKNITMQEKDKADIVLTQYFPEIFDPVKFLAKTLENVYGSVFTEPANCLNVLKFIADCRKKRMQHPLEHSDQSALIFVPLRDENADLTKSGLIITDTSDLPLPESEEDIAFASIAELAGWIKSGKLSSERLTNIYLNRLKKYGDTLMCVITLTEDIAIKQAKQADLEISQGKYRGVLHGIPYGLKDIVDTAGIPTTWGMEFHRNRIPTEDATLVKLLNAAGAVLVAKLSLHRISGHIPSFAGDTRNPWDLEESAYGSSSGPAASVAAGLVAFSLGSEIGGSLVAPCSICGAVGLRASFGRISQAGVFAYGSMDKLGPICRTIEDTAIVLSVVAKRDPQDAYTADIPFYFNSDEKLPKLRIGLNKNWAEDLDKFDSNMLKKIKSIFEIVEFTDEDYEIDSGFEIWLDRLLLNGQCSMILNDFKYQNTDKIQDKFDKMLCGTEGRLLSSLEFNHVQQLRRKTMQRIQKLFTDVDLLIVETCANPTTQIFNSTGHPALVVPIGRDKDGSHSFTLIGRMYDEGTLCRAGMELEKLFNFKDRPMAYKNVRQ